MRHLDNQSINTTAGQGPSTGTTSLLTGAYQALPRKVRAWPPAIIRDFVNTFCPARLAVSTETPLGDIIDYLSSSPDAVVAVFENGKIKGALVDDDVMALVKRFGARALEFDASIALQTGRPCVSATDSPYVVLQAMREGIWDRCVVTEKGEIVGIVRRRDLVRFVED